VAGIPDEIGQLLLIAHNPGLEELLEPLAGIYTPLTTAALAHLELPVERWSELSAESRGKLLHLWQPRELEDS
jgi:phosphohistidine phosphatase